jgi:ParB-like chromosome segregation protein Spo0J
LSEEDYAEVLADVKENGFIEPVAATVDGVLIDGRNRIQIACDLKISVVIKRINPEPVMAYVDSQNLHRRHLDAGQMAFHRLDALPIYEAEAKLRMQQAMGQPRGVKSAEATGPQGTERAPQSSDEVAAGKGTSGRSVRRAKRIRDLAPKLEQRVWSGELSLKSAERVAIQKQKQSAAVEPKGWNKPPGYTPERPRGNIQHFDLWNLEVSNSPRRDSYFFGQMRPQVVENLLWAYTVPGQMVFDPFGGTGTTLDVARYMGRSAWLSDRKPTRTEITQHDITQGWPASAPDQVDFILLDPPYWMQARGRYSDDPADFGNMSLKQFNAAWLQTVQVCTEHLRTGGHLAFIVSHTQSKGGSTVEDHMFEMDEAVRSTGLNRIRRMMVPYSTQQATAFHVNWARENRKFLKLYRDLVVFTR